MNRLFDIGFQHVGHWQLGDDDQPIPTLTMHAAQKNILYAFVSDGIVMYVGKTVQTLAKRIYGYKKPGKTQTTNVKNRHLIQQLLKQGAAVDILALPDNGLMHYGQFHINLAAGLEDSIIQTLKPAWNGLESTGLIEAGVESVAPPEAIADSFHFKLHATYYKCGFFNVPIAHSASLGGDGQPIEIYCGTNPDPIIGYINRTANQNATPRILGSTALRDWWQNAASEMQQLRVLVLSPNSIRIVIP